MAIYRVKLLNKRLKPFKPVESNFALANAVRNYKEETGFVIKGKVQLLQLVANEAAKPNANNSKT